MSEVWLKVIPTDPNYVPDATSQNEALQLAQSFLPEADGVHVRNTETVEFIDQGGNFERVVCPYCRAEILTEWWQKAMDVAYQEQFVKLDIITPCCQTTASLNDLQYVWPAGFARFRLEVLNPNIASLSQERVGRIAQILGCPLRVILAHY
jgi:hypothetical protein